MNYHQKAIELECGFPVHVYFTQTVCRCSSLDPLCHHNDERDSWLILSSCGRFSSSLAGKLFRWARTRVSMWETSKQARCEKQRFHHLHFSPPLLLPFFFFFLRMKLSFFIQLVKMPLNCGSAYLDHYLWCPAHVQVACDWHCQLVHLLRRAFFFFNMLLILSLVTVVSLPGPSRHGPPGVSSPCNWREVEQNSATWRGADAEVGQTEAVDCQLLLLLLVLFAFVVVIVVCCLLLLLFLVLETSSWVCLKNIVLLRTGCV